jgi:ABC-2 type transport system ATP-binding protein
VAGDLDALPGVLAGVEPTLSIQEDGEPRADGFRVLTLTTARDDELGELLLQALHERNFRVRTLSRRQPSLEDVFLAATRRSWDAVAPLPGRGVNGTPSR